MSVKHSKALLVVAMLALGSQSAHSQNAPTQVSNMQEHIKSQSTIDAMTSAFTTHDIDGVLSAYESGAVVVDQPGSPVTGTPALRAMFQQFVALDTKFTFTDQEIIQAGDIALHFNTWKMTGKAPDGTPVEQGGLSVVILRK